MTKPVYIGEMDIAEKDLYISDQGKYETAFLMLRSGCSVLKMQRVRFKNGCIRHDDVFRSARHEMSYRLALSDLKKFTGIPEPVEDYTPGISVVVCTRDRADLLMDCINALLSQEYPDFEILVVDNASETDETRNLVISKGLRYIREDKPGLDRARNRGIMEATKEIIAFTDDDARVDRNWLKAIGKNFRNVDTQAVTGFVAPYELKTFAQQIFEWNYGGMGHGFIKRVYDGRKMSMRQKIAASGFGVGANMAFRKSWFEKAGQFDPALDVGTPSCGGGDVEMLHRVVAANGVIVYDPDVFVWHIHRTGIEALKRQVFNNGRSFVCYLFTCYRNKTVSTGSLITFFFYNWLYKWHFKNILFGNGRVSRKLLLTELKGMLTGPSAYFSSRRFASAWNQV